MPPPGIVANGGAAPQGAIDIEDGSPHKDEVKDEAAARAAARAAFAAQRLRASTSGPPAASAHDDSTCPLCCENLTEQEIDFLPCACSYKICIFCWHRIRDDGDGLCPACRTTYPEEPFRFGSKAKPLPADAGAGKKKKKTKKQQDSAESSSSASLAAAPVPPPGAPSQPSSAAAGGIPAVYAEPHSEVGAEDSASKKKKKKKKSSAAEDDQSNNPVGRGCSLEALTSFLKLTEGTVEALLREDYDSDCVIDSVLKDFLSIGCSPEDSEKLIRWSDAHRS